VGSRFGLCSVILGIVMFSVVFASAANNSSNATVTPTPFPSPVPTITPTPTPTPTPANYFQVTMQKGWTLFSVPLAAPMVINQSCASSTTWSYNPTTYLYTQATLKSLSAGKAYWFYSNSACAVQFNASKAYRVQDVNIALKTGWNMIAAPASADGYSPVPISSIAGNCYITSTQTYLPGMDNWNESTLMMQGSGYFVKVSGPCTMSANTSAIKPPMPK
jgi:hypothetical protein